MGLMVLSMLVVGLVILTLGSDLLVRGASRLALAVGITPLVVGLTVVAFGTSAPELAVSVQGAVGGQADVAIGNVVGSNIFNTLVILGLAALVAPLTVDRQLLRSDVPLMIGASLLTLLVAWDGQVGRIEGAVLFAGIVIYTIRAIKIGLAGGKVTAEGDDLPSPDEAPRTAAQAIKQIGFMIAGLALMVLGARWFINSAVDIARWLGMSELVIGLTIVAAGTSLPEVATSVMATLRGERDIAIGNVVGSNIFNLFSVLGLTSFIQPIHVAPAALAVDIPFMVATAFLCLPIFLTKYLIDRLEGAILLTIYALYVTFLILSNTGSPSLATFTSALVWPTAALGVFLLVSLIRHFRAEQAAPNTWTT
jgi:cation:H+ antiporter